MTRAQLAAELEQLDQEVARVEARLRRTVDPGRIEALERQLAGLREERRVVAVDLTAAELRAMRDSPHPPEAVVPKKAMGPFLGAFVGRVPPIFHRNRRLAS